MPNQDNNRLTPAERELELALARLQPTPTSMAKDRLLIEAGRRDGQRQRGFWKAAAAMLALLACLSWAIRPPARIVERIVYIETPPTVQQAPTAIATPAPPTPVTGPRYIDVRQAAAEHGLDAAAALDEQPTEPQTNTLFYGLIQYKTAQGKNDQ